MGIFGIVYSSLKSLGFKIRDIRINKGKIKISNEPVAGMKYVCHDAFLDKYMVVQIKLK